MGCHFRKITLEDTDFDQISHNWLEFCIVLTILGYIFEWPSRTLNKIASKSGLKGLNIEKQLLVQRMVSLVPWVPEPKNNKKKKVRNERKLSSFSLFLLPVSFHLNFEALVPRVCRWQLCCKEYWRWEGAISCCSLEVRGHIVTCDNGGRTSESFEACWPEK